MSHKILTADEIAAALAKLPDWRYEAPEIRADFTLATFRDAIAFIVQVAIEAEVMNHHPEFCNSWTRVSFAFCTHDVGNKIADTDIELDRRDGGAVRAGIAGRTVHAEASVSGTRVGQLGRIPLEAATECRIKNA